MTEPSRLPVTLSGADVRTMRSADGHAYSILSAVPSTPPPASGFPVIYLLDANATFCTMVEAIRMRSHRPQTTGVTPAVVIGIGHPQADPYDRERRRLDFTPPPAEGGLPTLFTGGPAAFYDFLLGVRDDVERDLPVSRTQRTLLGHSLGGLFVVMVLLERPRTFERYIAASPSLWSAWDAITERAARFGGAADTRGGAYFGVGGFEEALAPWEAAAKDAQAILARRQSRQMVARCRDLAATLQQREPRFRVVFHEFPGEDHASVVLRCISRGLQFALGPEIGLDWSDIPT